MTARSAVTVIVPTRNEAHNIPSLLRSLPPDVPLIAVDSSTDDTPDLIRQQRPASTRLVEYRATVSEARQIGAKMARTPWLLFTDADIKFADDYFDHLPEALTADLVYGPKLSTTGYRAYYRWFSWGMGALLRLGIPAASGSNLIIHRDAFAAVGGFDLTLTVNEDTEIAFRVRRAGYRVAFDRRLRVYATDHRRLDKGVIRKTVHSLARGALLYSGLMPRRWRSHDWGYW
jgi:glycosyltransferase involved in cell wall biosynthesis